MLHNSYWLLVAGLIAQCSFLSLPGERVVKFKPFFDRVEPILLTYGYTKGRVFTPSTFMRPKPTDEYMVFKKVSGKAEVTFLVSIEEPSKVLRVNFNVTNHSSEPKHVIKKLFAEVDVIRQKLDEIPR